jgi:hypothetical protein
VAHSYSGGRDQEDRDSKATSGKNLARPHLNKNAGHDGVDLSSSYMGGVSRRITVQASLGQKNTRTYLKNN